MNVSTLSIPKETAARKAEEYAGLSGKQRGKEDDAMENLYKSIAKSGVKVINILDAFRQTGLNEKGQPKLAIARADWRTVYFHQRANFNQWFSRSNRGGGGFGAGSQWNKNAKASNIVLPENTFDNEKLTKSDLKSSVPHVPPRLRPKINARNFHILFEVQNWETYPVDPFLLRRIQGNLFLIIAEWELTPLEASILEAINENG